MWAVDIEYSIPEFAMVEVEADTEEQAHEFALEQFRETWPEAYDINVVRVKKN